MSDTILVIIQYILAFFTILIVGAFWSKASTSIIDEIITSRMTDKEIEEKTR